MIIKPILFNTEMVRAILDGRKTVTRRVVKPQPKSKLAYACMGDGCGKWSYPGKDAWKYWDDESFRLPGDISQDELERRWTPPYHADDILYVRETWVQAAGHIFWYKADSPVQNICWHPSIHMPKEAARLFLKVTDVRVERLQDITDEGAKAEGANWRNGKHVGFEEKMWRSAVDRFAEIWDTTIKPADLPPYGWDANPWVWVIEFERISKEEAQNGVG